MATKCSSVEFCGKMASDKANEIAKIVNSYDCYSANDQQSLLAVMGDYFTSNEDPDEDLFFENGGGKLCKLQFSK